MPLFEKHFTLEEANAVLPELTELLAAIREARDRMVVDWRQAMPVLRAAKLNGGGKEATAYLSDIQKLNARLQRLAELGVELKDIERGLIDFPAWRGGEEVLLCWLVGEERVAFWHTLEAGFAGRQPI